MMVEVPAAVMMIDHFVEEVDFLSIGTNDLIQYTLAVDRSNKDVVRLVQPGRSGRAEADCHGASRPPTAKNVPINMCGQMSGSPLYTMLLLGMGLRRFSVTPSAIPEVKNVCRSVTIAECEAVAARVMTHGKRPRRQELSEGRSEETRSRDCRADVGRSEVRACRPATMASRSEMRLPPTASDNSEFPPSNG